MVEDHTTEVSKTHRQFAADLFNRVWDLMEKEDRTESDALEMIHAAHASRYHWGAVETPIHFARGEWQISRVYSILGFGESALRHAEYCLNWCQREDLGAFDLAFAHEALARAFRVLDDIEKVNHHVAEAQKIAEDIDDEENRQWLAENLNTV